MLKTKRYNKIKKLFISQNDSLMTMSNDLKLIIMSHFLFKLSLMN